MSIVSESVLVSVYGSCAQSLEKGWCTEKARYDSNNKKSVAPTCLQSDYASYHDGHFHLACASSLTLVLAEI